MKVLKLSEKQALNNNIEGTPNTVYMRDTNKDLNLELHFENNNDIMELLEVTNVIKATLKTYEKTLKTEGRDVEVKQDGVITIVKKKVNTTVAKKLVIQRKNQLINDLKEEHGKSGVELVTSLMTKGSEKFIGGVAIERVSLIVTVIGKDRNYKITKELLGLDGEATEKDIELLLNKTTSKEFLKTSELENDTTVNWNKFLETFITEGDNKISEVRKDGLFFDHMKENTELALETKNGNNNFLCSLVAKYISEKPLLEVTK